MAERRYNPNALAAARRKAVTWADLATTDRYPRPAMQSALREAALIIEQLAQTVEQMHARDQEARRVMAAVRRLRSLIESQP